MPINCGADQGACRGKTLITPKSFSEGREFNQAKADRSDRRPKKAASHTL